MIEPLQLSLELAGPPDRAARDRIDTDLSSTLFVEAGAGSGKTSALVNRVLALVQEGVELRHIAAITFTEKAAAELRDRVRQKLERTADERAGSEVGDRCRAALDQLDGSAIGTLHSFAQRLLSEHPVEAGLPPKVDVLDEVSSGVEFERRWATFRDVLLADPALERTLLLLLASGVQEAALRALASAFGENWDLVEERVPGDAPDPPDVHRLLAPVRRALLELCEERDACADQTDGMVQRLCEIAEHMERLGAIDDEIDLLEALHPDAPVKAPSFSVGRTGRKPSWRPYDLDELRDRVKEAGAGLAGVQEQVSQACVRRIAAEIRRFTLDAAAERRAAGRLEFHDLLVLARGMLRDAVHGPAVRTALARRYRRLLLDEFQDTDPIQVELAVRIAAADPASEEAGEARWDDVAVAPGRLFVVGDPKQSIYRFRRADISTFLAARDRFGPDAGGLVQLTANFRTGEPVIGWVNRVFGRLMAEVPEVDVPVESQPRYVGLHAVRPAPPTGPPVSVIGREIHPRGWAADELRTAEAADVAAVIARIVDEEWSVDDGPGGWRPAKLGDITVLVPARTSLPFLEDALDAAAIPFRAESSSLVYATRAVRDLLMVLRAVDDPTDHLRIVSALRTPLFGCGDDDLFRYKREHRGSWNYLAPRPDSMPPDDRVAAGLAYVRTIHDLRQWRSPSELLDQVARDRRALELGFAEGRPRDVWRRLRFVIDQARAWSEATGGSLRQYLHWVDQQSAEGARVAESILPETDDDAVRIMTIHAAKGLEFGVTIVSGMTTVPQSRTAPAQVLWPPDPKEKVGYRFGRFVKTPEFAKWAPIDEQMAFDERVRLLYVAATRARDHLVVSLHRRERANPPRPSNRTNAELLLDGMGDALDALPDAAAPEPAAVARVFEVEAPPAPPPFETWHAERAAALERAGRPTAVAATALTDEGQPDVEPEPAEPEPAEPEPAAPTAPAEPDAGLQKRPRDLDLPPWLKGRYGTAVGRAVHGVLQTVDLATAAVTPGAVDAAVAAQCEAEAVPERAGDVRGLVGYALAAPAVREAAAAPHWREVYACTPLDGRLLEGYVDLLYRGPQGLVVVDYKTAATADRRELDRRVDGYRLQGASYALAVGAATGEPVTRVTFLFLTPEGAVQRDLPDLAAALADVEALVRAGREHVVG